MKVEIITIGDELLIGQTIDTNSAWMGRELSNLGFALNRRTAVADAAEDIKSAIGEAFGRVDLVILTGGLGPTKDDITKKTLCELYGCGLRRDEHVLAHLSRLFEKRGRQLLEINKIQADLPELCETLTNEVGTAPGMWFDQNGKVLVSMPGVPNEMMHIMTERVFPRLKNRFSTGTILHRTLLTINIAESLLSNHLESFESALPDGFTLAYLPALNTVKLRLTSRSEGAEPDAQMDKLFHTLCELCREWMFAPEDVVPARYMARMFLENNLRFTLAESCTGGYIANQLLLEPGVSAICDGAQITYSNAVKMRELGVPESIFSTVGAVSEECARYMADGIRKKMGADVAISTTGIAGPGGATPEKPVGLIYIGVSTAQQTVVKKYKLFGTREQFMQRACNCAMQLTMQVLKGEAAMISDSI
ncbi:MAG: CinA family nicotinamide mononucleotide deamidase-related protein [Bacteroidetes bacterium]|nr:CinA family nicotinamide mononucleotide deamidase-related protein [Bacteroidota bacterium]